MREVRHEPARRVEAPRPHARVYVIPEPWTVSTARRAGALLGEMVRNTGEPYTLASVGHYARRHPFAMFTAAALGFVAGRFMLRVGDLLMEV